MSIVSLDDFSTDLLLLTDHVSVVFRVELRGQFGRVHQITEHHGELPSFRIRRRGRREKCNLRGVLFLGSRRLRWLSRGSGDFLCISEPDKNSVIFVAGKPFCLNQVNLQVFDVVVIQITPAL